MLKPKSMKKNRVAHSGSINFENFLQPKRAKKEQKGGDKTTPFFCGNSEVGYTWFLRKNRALFRALFLGHFATMRVKGK